MSAPRAGHSRSSKRYSASSSDRLAACTLALCLSACIQVNEDFDSPLKLAQEAVQNQSPGTSVGALDTATGKDTTRIDDQESSAPKHPLNDSTSLSSQASFSTSSSSETSSVSSSSPTSSMSSTIASSASSTSSSAPPKSRAIPIQLTNDDRNRSVPTRSSIRLAFDHRSMVFAGAAQDGSDLRIFYTPSGGSRREIHRVLDPGSAWNTQTTTLWFTIGTPLAASAQESAAYELVIDKDASTPLANPDGIFLLYDGFEGNSLNTQKWATGRSGGASSTASVSIQGGILSLDASCVGPDSCSRFLRSNESWQESGIVFESAMAVSGQLRDCTREYIQGFWSPLPSTFIRAAWMQRQQGYNFVNHSDNGPFNIRPMQGGRSPQNFLRYKTQWRGNNLSMYRNSVPIDQKTPFDTAFVRPEHGPLIVGVEAFANGGACQGERSLIEIDWAMVYLAASTQVSTQLRFDLERELP